MGDCAARHVARYLDTVTRGQREVLGHPQSSRVVGRGEHYDTPAKRQPLSWQLAWDEEVHSTEVCRPWAPQQQLLAN